VISWKDVDIYSRGGLLAYTKNLLRNAGIRPRKRLGQHFTIDPSLIEEIMRLVSQYGCESSKPIVEIGTGFGVLTAQLARRCWRVITIEIDRRIYNLAREMLRSISNVDIICGDALEVLENLEYYQGVVGTIPYSITGPLMGAIARGKAIWGVLVLQKDVVDRITSPPGTREYGSIGVLLNTAFEISRGRIYSPQSFYPEPDVFSQTIAIKRRGEIKIDRDFEGFVKCIFSQRKRLAHRAIKKCLGIETPEMKKRVFQLSPDEIYNIYRNLKQIN